MVSDVFNLHPYIEEASDGSTDGTEVQVRGGVVYSNRFRAGGSSSTVRRCRLTTSG